jgi:hypothetical protein
MTNSADAERNIRRRKNEETKNVLRLIGKPPFGIEFKNP